MQILDTGKLVFDGGTENETTEGPKIYKRDGMYYILAPAGGVTGGWQLAMRSANPYGPLRNPPRSPAGVHPGQRPASGRLGGYALWRRLVHPFSGYRRIRPHSPFTARALGGRLPDMGNNGEPVLTHEAPKNKRSNRAGYPDFGHV